MARTLQLGLVVSGLFASIGAPAALAQAPYVRPSVDPYNRPAFSPYLNLGRGGSPAINYYGLVRPQQQFGTSIQQLREADTNLLNAAATAGVAPVTGVQAGYMNFSHYYGARPTGSATLRSAVTPNAIVPPAIVSPVSSLVPKTR